MPIGKRKQIKITDRQQESFDLWKSGKTLREVGKILNVAHQTVANDVNKAVQARSAEFSDQVETWRTVQLDRLHDIYTTYQPKAEKGDKEAAEIVLKTLKSISDITGIKAAQKIDLNGTLQVATRVIEPTE